LSSEPEVPPRVRELAQKILPADRLIDLLRRPRERSLAFTNGCFDILHRGHVEYLAFARAQADQLVVALNTDESVRLLKGPSRPINSLDDRLHVIAALESVDWVTSFSEETPLALISALLPDVLVKGADYTIASVVGAAEVQEAGGRVVLAPLVANRSTTDVINRSRTEHTP
jgi:rfaE bifunctional protein nucleotidyltransferase chain/domain